MLYPSEREWAEWGIVDECHKFFVLHWDELFDAETSDSWQVRTCNILSLLEEMIDAARIAESFDAYRGVLRSILDEAFPVMSRDAIIKAYYPFVPAYLEVWRKKEIGKSDPAEVQRLATVILGNLKDYWENGVELVLELLIIADKGKKKELYDATLNLGIATAARGRSTSYLRDAVRTRVLIQSDRRFIDRVRDMFRDFAQGERNYECLFWTDGVKRHLADSLPSDIQLHFGRPDDLPAEPADPFFKQATRQAISLRVKVEATDPEAAWRRADQRLGEVFAGLNLYSIDDRYQVKPLNVLIKDEVGAVTIVGHRRLGTQYLGSYDSRQFKAEMLFRVLGRTKEQDAAQISSAIQYHRLALQATSDEARLLNLWIALEALCQGEDGSIIERVHTLIAPCVSLENIQKNLTSLALYVRFLWDVSDRAEFLKYFPTSTEDRLEPSDLVNLLLLPDKDESLKQFCELCARHPLILHRLFRSKTMVLNAPTSIAKNLEDSVQNVEWQLKRIYRVRNAIVHTGSSNKLLPQLTQHLHCYMVKAIKSVLTELDRNPTWSIRDALEHRRILFEHVVRFFKKTPGHQISTKAILQPQVCMQPQREPFAWLVIEQPAVGPVNADGKDANASKEPAPPEDNTRGQKDTHFDASPPADASPTDRDGDL